MSLLPPTQEGIPVLWLVSDHQPGFSASTRSEFPLWSWHRLYPRYSPIKLQADLLQPVRARVYRIVAVRKKTMGRSTER